MSNRLYQTVLHQMKDVIGRTIGIIDENGIIIACSELSKIPHPAEFDKYYNL